MGKWLDGEGRVCGRAALVVGRPLQRVATWEASRQMAYTRQMPIIPSLAFLLVAALADADSAAGRTGQCTYAARASKANPSLELASRGACCIYGADGAPRFEKRMLSAIQRNPEGLGAVFVDGDGWYYVDRKGGAAKVLAWDNGPDDFVDGVARSAQGGKIGYLDRTLRFVIPPAYDFAWPFENGRAMVCVGCAMGRLDEDGHAVVEGGLWGYIDRKGKEVIPVRYSQSELESLPAHQN